MAYVRIAIHAVWGTKNREKLLTDSIRQAVINHIMENASSKQIFIDRLNGTSDHLHCLFWLNADLSIAKVMQLIKGESAHWINKSGLLQHKFEWADEYYAASVSESILNNVRSYIDNQEEHHRKKSFKEECDEFFKSTNF